MKRDLEGVPESELISAAHDRDDDAIFGLWDEFAHRGAVAPILETLKIRTKRGRIPNEVRRRAAEAIARVGGQEASDALIGFLGFDREVAAAAATGILRIGDPLGMALAGFGDWKLSTKTVERLRETIRSLDAQHREQLVQSVDPSSRNWGPGSRNWELSVALLGLGGSDFLAAAVSEGLLLTGDPQCIEAAMSAVAREVGKSRAWESRRGIPRTVRLLIGIRNTEAVEVLRKALIGTQEAGWAFMLVNALAEIGTTDAARALSDALQDWEHRLQGAAVQDEKVWNLQLWAISAIERLGDPAAIPGLVRVLSRDRPTARNELLTYNMVIANSENISSAYGALGGILGIRRVDASTEDLRSVLSLKPFTHWDPRVEDEPERVKKTFDPEPLLKLARDELQRRGAKD